LQKQGGQLPLFRGGRHDQDCAGLGRILSGIFRHVAPIARRIVPYAVRAARTAVNTAARGLASFAQNTLSAHQQGVPLGEAAKAAILLALGDAAMVLDKQQSGGTRRAPSRKRANTNVVGAGIDQPSQPKRRWRAAHKRRQTGTGTEPPAKSRRKQTGGAMRRKQTGGAKRRAPAKRTAQKGGRKRYIRSEVAVLSAKPFASPAQCYHSVTSSKGLKDGAGRIN
jgi:hypothetical protein